MSINIQHNGKLVRFSTHEHTNKELLDIITNSKIEEWDNKSEFSGDYNDLTNKPEIVDDGSNQLLIVDDSGNIIFKVDEEGVQSTNITVNSINLATQDYINEKLGFDTSEIVFDNTINADRTLIGITVTYNGGDVIVGTKVDALVGIVVTARYSDGSLDIVSDYTLSGEIKEGTNSIVVTYEEKMAAFNVVGYVVTLNTISAVRANYSGPQIPYGSTLDDLRQYLEVKAEYPDGSSEIVLDYELSGELKKNSNNKITVTYGGKTTTFYVWAQVIMCTVNITAIPSDAKVMLNGRNSRSENVESGSIVTYEVSKDGYETKTGEILVMKNEDIIVELAVVKNVSAVRATSDGTQIPYGSTLDDLRQHLEVKAEYPDGSSEVVTDYELSGELKKNSNNKITVTYGGKTTTVYVWVQAVIYTVNITVIPGDAKVMLNGRNSRSENVESGSIVTYEVSKNGYITQTGEILVTKNEDITITLVEQTE